MSKQEPLFTICTEARKCKALYCIWNLAGISFQTFVFVFSYLTLDLPLTLVFIRYLPQALCQRNM